MSIDAYDTLGVGLDATEEDIKRAFKKLSLQNHPDKVAQDSESKRLAEEKFNDITFAKEVLLDVERRKIYDTFGVDLGKERPEVEVWTLGLTTLLNPVCGFTLKTFLSRAAIWLISFVWVGRLVLLVGLCLAGLYAVNRPIRGVDFRSPELCYNLMLPMGIIDLTVLLFWVWSLTADGIGVFYLISELGGMALYSKNWHLAALGAGSLFLAWLVRGWWFWIICIEVVLAVVLLLALTVAVGIVKLWIDSVHTQSGEKLKTWRLDMRKDRERLKERVQSLEEEAAKLKQKTGAAGR